jgi:ribosomal protein L16 Arg81 hydroxylase
MEHSALASPAALAAAHKGPTLALAALEGGGTHEQPIAAQDAAARLAQGAVVVFHRLENTVAPIARWVRAWEAALSLPGGSVVCAAFCAGAGQGMPKHCDPRELFVLQVAGTKVWEIEENSEVPYPIGNVFPPRTMSPELASHVERPLSPEMGKGAQRGTLSPGSALYVPLGWWHRTEAAADSVTLSFSAPRPRWADIALDALRGILMQRAEWRAPAPLPEALRSLEGKAMAQMRCAELEALCSALSVDELLSRAERGERRGR